MTFDEAIPIVGGAIWTRLDAFLFEDVEDRLSADFLERQFSKLGDSLNWPEAHGLCRFEDQRPKLLQFPLISCEPFYFTADAFASPQKIIELATIQRQLCRLRVVNDIIVLTSTLLLLDLARDFQLHWQSAS